MRNVIIYIALATLGSHWPLVNKATLPIYQTSTTCVRRMRTSRTRTLTHTRGWVLDLEARDGASTMTMMLSARLPTIARRDQMAIISLFCSVSAYSGYVLNVASNKLCATHSHTHPLAHTQFFAYLPTIIGIITMPTIRGEP